MSASGPAARVNDQRGSARFLVLIRPAKLIHGRFEYPCVLRDVSDSGISVRVFDPVAGRTGFEIEMLGGMRYPVDLIWQDGLSVGFQFQRSIDINEILANAGPYPNRPMRLAMDLPAVIEHGAHKSQATLINISQQGARVACSDYLALGQPVVLQSDRLPRIHAKVRWRKPDGYGLVFENTFKLAELSAVAVRLYGSPAFQHGTTKSSAA